jgi:glycerol-3-phosphate acyltransferase PlsX
MSRIVIDVMGGDQAPLAILLGVCEAIPEFDLHRDALVLVGDEAQIRSEVESNPRLKRLKKALLSSRVQDASKAEDSNQTSTDLPGISILHAPEVIQMEDSIRAIRNKPLASINLGCKLAAEGFQASKVTRSPSQGGLKSPLAPPTAFISAGHSGAVMASALLTLGRLKGIERPAIAVTLPTLNPEGCVLVDAGANVDCKPQHLKDFAIMGALFASAECKSNRLPRIGLLSNGEEKSKGNDLTRQSAQLLATCPVFEVPPESPPESAATSSSQENDPRGCPRVGVYTGYVEGKELFKGAVDVVVTDGFVGNVVLKALEGLGSAVVTILKREMKRNPLAPLGYLLSFSAFRRLKRKLDYAEYGAAPLLGVAGYVFICHGRSGPRAIKNAILRTRTALASQFVEKLEVALDQVQNQPKATSEGGTHP